MTDDFEVFNLFVLPQGSFFVTFCAVTCACVRPDCPRAQHFAPLMGGSCRARTRTLSSILTLALHVLTRPMESREVGVALSQEVRDAVIQ